MKWAGPRPKTYHLNHYLVTWFGYQQVQVQPKPIGKTESNEDCSTSNLDLRQSPRHRHHRRPSTKRQLSSSNFVSSTTPFRCFGIFPLSSSYNLLSFVTWFYRTESFDLSLARYGITGVRASGNITHFVDRNRVPQVGITLWLLGFFNSSC